MSDIFNNKKISFPKLDKKPTTSILQNHVDLSTKSIAIKRSLEKNNAKFIGYGETGKKMQMLHNMGRDNQLQQVMSSETFGLDANERIKVEKELVNNKPINYFQKPSNNSTGDIYGQSLTDEEKRNISLAKKEQVKFDDPNSFSNIYKDLKKDDENKEDKVTEKKINADVFKKHF